MNDGPFSNAKVLVTGATGFIGQHLCVALRRVGARVYGIRRDFTAETVLFIHQDHVNWVVADIRDLHALKNAVEAVQPSHIFNLAAITGHEADNDRQMVEVNLLGTMNLLRALEGHDYSRFIQVGTAAEYGNTAMHVDEAATLKPDSSYAVSKAAASLFCEMSNRLDGHPVTIVRPFLVYGPGQSRDYFIPQAIVAGLTGQQLPMTSGEQKRDFTYIDDLVTGLMLAASSEASVGESFNIGTGKLLTLREVSEMITQITGAPETPDYGALPYRTGEVWSFACDNSKARKILDWHSHIDIETGIRRTTDWYRNSIAPLANDSEQAL